MVLRVFTFTILAAAALNAQEGDEAGEEQKARVPAEIIPPSPPLPPADALKSFKLQPGFEIQLVAAEPMIEAPICIQFDPDGRLWVLEMRGYMRNLAGEGELEPNGRVSVLEDTNGDGRMDKSTVFLDGLVLPRALMLFRDGVVIAEPPKLWFCRDTNGDGKCDEKTEIAGDYATQSDPKLGARTNPEHASNGLLWALDNWIYSANHTVRYRNTDGTWRKEPTKFRGQWGITQGDYGRLFYNSNEDPLRADLAPAEYLDRNPHLRNPSGRNVQLYQDKSVWPARVNPGVNRGYRPGQLQPDGRLATFTAACAPLVYRGDNFPQEFRGNVFVCEPGGNLIRRYVLTEENLSVRAANAYHEAEFLASTDERFRPVNLQNGPDGALYIVDMYRGILQHRLYVTTYLRGQILDRGLEQPIDRGRIYRIVHKSGRRVRKPRMTQAGSADLVQNLSHGNGWWRDTAQRLLVERNDAAAVPALRKLARSGKEPPGRLHALWTLEGMGQLDRETATAGLSDSHPKVRAAAIRLCEPFLKSASKPAVLPPLLYLANDRAPDVQLQLALTLGEITEPQAEEAILRILQACPTNACIRDAALSGLGGRELEFLQRLLKTGNEEIPGFDAVLGSLAKCVFVEAKPERIVALLELAAGSSTPAPWQRLALLDGILDSSPATRRGRPAPAIKPVRLDSEPAALAALGQIEDAAIKERVPKVAALLTWPGKPGARPEKEARPLTAEQQKRFEAGKELYLISCAACHQPHGNGQEGLAPPLTDSEWTLGSEQRLIRMVLHGVRGPIHVKGQVYQLDMPALGVFDDEQIASLLTYVRREWGHTADPVEPPTVAKVREATAQREEAWSEAELLQIP